MVIACSAMSRALRLLWRTSARAAASAYGPPEPTATTPSSGSIKSPVPESRKVDDVSATMSIASSRRRMRSLRQSLASSTADRSRLPRYCSSLASNLVKRAKASAADPAKPARMESLCSRRILRAPCFMTVLPKVTWPSPAMTVWPPWRTARIVVAWITLPVCRTARPPAAQAARCPEPGSAGQGSVEDNGPVARVCPADLGQNPPIGYGRDPAQREGMGKTTFVATAVLAALVTAAPLANAQGRHHGGDGGGGRQRNPSRADS